MSLAATTTRAVLPATIAGELLARQRAVAEGDTQARPALRQGPV